MAKGTGAGLLERARKHIGEKYVNRQVPKDDPDWAGPWDCAEFVSWLVYQEAGVLYGCTDNKASPASADAYTGAWQRDAREIGLLVPVEQAAATVGGVLLRYPPEPGKMGHIVVCDGKGGTVEAMGVKYGVVAGTVQGRRWDTGVLVPGIAYGGGAAASLAVTPPNELYALNMPNMSAAVVTEIQKALKAKGFDPGGVDGDFGRKTMQAVAAFQESLGLVVDGEVGATTAQSLGVSLLGAAAAAAGTVVKGIVATNPILAIAASLLPDIVRAIVGDKAGAVAASVTRAVTDVAGTTDPVQAQARIAADPVAAAQVQLKLAEIATAQDDARRKAEVEAQRALDVAAEKRREDDLAFFREQLKDTANARSSALEWARLGGPMSWGAPVVSVIVTLGFFGVLVVLLAGSALTGLAPGSPIFQIVNIVIGALVAGFSTVVSFWLGSSEGSRQKDATSAGMQIKQAEQNDAILKSNAEALVKAQNQAPPAPSPPPSAGEAAKPAALPASARFQRCVELVLLKEGDDYVNHPLDKGGPTRHGITIETLRRWRETRDPGSGAAVTEDDVRDLKVEEAKDIYRSFYWNVLRCDELPAGVDLMTFDFGVNGGTGRAAKMLQKAVGAETDGSVGPVTTGATSNFTPQTIIASMKRQRMEHYQSLSNWPTFGNGWTNRTNAIETAALAMIGGRAAA